MSPVLAITTLFCIYAFSEFIAIKTKAIFSTVLALSILLLIGFWSGILPQTIFADAAVDKIGNIAAGILIVSLGTTIDLHELKQQWRVVFVSFVAVTCAVMLIAVAGPLFMDESSALAGAPIFAGGSAATLIMTAALKEKGLEAISTFCIVLYVTQKFFGVPIASILLRQEAKFFIQNKERVKAYLHKDNNPPATKRDRKPLAIPQSLQKPMTYFAKLGIVSTIAFHLSKLIDGKIHYFVMSLIMGVIFYSLGFLEDNILEKTQSSTIITFLTTIVIFTNLASTTIAQVLSVIQPILISALLGVTGVFISGYILGKLLKISPKLAIAMGISCTFGFPTTVIIPREISEAIGTTSEEKQAIENYLLPQMLTAGLVTVTISSVILAGAVVNML